MGQEFKENLKSTIGADTEKVVTVDRQDVNTRMGKDKDAWNPKDPAEEFPSMKARATYDTQKIRRPRGSGTCF